MANIAIPAFAGDADLVRAGTRRIGDVPVNLLLPLLH